MANAQDLVLAQQAIDQGNDRVIIRGGKIYVWRPDTEQNAGAFSGVNPAGQYGQNADPNAPTDWGPNEGPGTWVEGSFLHPGGLSLWKPLLGMAVAGAGGQFAADTFLGAGAAGAAGSGLGGASAATGGAGAVGAGTGAAGATGAEIGAGAGGGAAAATGGLLGKALPIIQAGTRTLGAIANQRALNRQTDANNALTAYQAGLLRTQIGDQQIDRDLAQRQYAAANYQRQLGNALRGGLLQGAQDVTITAPSQVPRATISGGLRPSAISGREDIGAALQRQAMLELLHPTQPGNSPSTDPQATRLPSLPTLPDVPPPPGSSGLDAALSYGALAGAGLSLLNDYLPHVSRVAPTPALPVITAPSPRGAMGAASFYPRGY